MDKSLTQSLNSIFRGVFFIMLGMPIARLLGYVYKIIVARISPEAYGILSLCLAILSIASTVAFLGLRDTLKRFVAFYNGAEKSEKVKGVILSSLKIGLVSSVIVTIILLIFSKKLTDVFFHNMEHLAYARFFVILIPFYVLSWIFLKAIVGFKKVEYRVFVNDIFWNLLKVIFTTVLIFLGMRIWAAILGYGLALIFSFVVSFFILEYKIFSVFRSKEVPSYDYKELFEFSLPLLFAGISGLFLLWTDTLMLGYFTEASKVGIYNAAALLASIIYLGSELFTPIYLPVVTELYAQKKKETFSKIYRSVNKWIFGISFPMFLLIAFFGFTLLRDVFGNSYVGGMTALVILCLGKLIQATSFTSLQMIKMVKKTKLYFIISLTSALINIALNFFLIPRYGINGAAIATAISLCIYAISAIMLCYHFLKIPFVNLSYLKIVLASFVALSLSWFIGLRIELNVFSAMLIFVIFGITYILTIVIIRTLDEEDRLVLSAIKNKVMPLLGIR